MSRYQYTKLFPTQLSLRLVHLLPGTPNTNLSISIVHASFTPTAPPKFETLSYTWGSESNPQTVSVIRQPVHKAATFLSRLRRKRNDNIAVSENPPHHPNSGEVLQVTQNQAIALRHLHNTSSIRVLWIDALCINQEDLQERSTEGKRMADIYRCESQVTIWLGPASEDH